MNKQQFGVGAVVKLNEEGRNHFPRRPDRLATVARLSRDPALVRIIWDGERSVKTIGVHLFDVVVPSKPAAPRSSYGFSVGDRVRPNESYLEQFPRDRGRAAIVIGFGRSPNLVWIKFLDRKQKTSVDASYLELTQSWGVSA
jgi:hypothetical protein